LQVPTFLDDDGLHGMVEKCGHLQLTAGNHVVYIDGFQAGGGVGMRATYSGPDTGGKVMYMLSGRLPSSSAGFYYPSCDPSQQSPDSKSFTVCMFRSEMSLGRIPSFGAADLGANRLYFVAKGQLPVVDVHSIDQFRDAVPGTPDYNYGWVIFGQLVIQQTGAYTLCIISDDG
jgi:hypothetical protein